MNKKIFGLIIGIAAVLFVAAVAMGAVSAKPTDVKIANQTFHIPDGYKEVNRTEDANQTNVLFEKDKNTTIIIGVANDNNFTNEKLFPGDVNKTIAGKNGVYNEKMKNFNYNQNGKFIAIFAPDEAVIEEIIK